jgi:hypothetical protein
MNNFYPTSASASNNTPQIELISINSNTFMIIHAGYSGSSIRYTTDGGTNWYSPSYVTPQYYSNFRLPYWGRITSYAVNGNDIDIVFDTGMTAKWVNFSIGNVPSSVNDSFTFNITNRDVRSSLYSAQSKQFVFSDFLAVEGNRVCYINNTTRMKLGKYNNSFGAQTGTTNTIRYHTRIK